LPTPNYQFEKRKRDLDKKAKKEEKQRRKREASLTKPADGAEGSPVTDSDPAAPAETV